MPRPRVHQPQEKADADALTRAAADARDALAANIKRLRATRKLSQERLAELAFLSVSYIAGLERPAREENPTLLGLVAVARALDVPLSELFAPVSERAARRPTRGPEPARGARRRKR